MTLAIPEELIGLCRKIQLENLSVREWARIESDDMFQTPNFIGGFDATENAFCFSYYSPSKQEYWFQLTIDEVTDVALRRLTTVEIRPAE
jgi:hypothetical protein